MNKTANFDLPQWEKSDFIQMDDFNAAFGTLDGALKTQADALAGKAGGEDLAAVRQEIVETRAANCLVKLAGPIVTAADNAEMNFDLSQVDMSKVAALFFTFCAGSSNGGMSIYANGTLLGTACSNSWSTTAGLIWLMPMSGMASFVSTLATNSNGGGTAAYGGVNAVKWEEVNSLSFRGTSTAGATATLFAVRK